MGVPSFSTNLLAVGWLKLEVKGTTTFVCAALSSKAKGRSEIESQVDLIPEFINDWDGTIYKKIPGAFWGKTTCFPVKLFPQTNPNLHFRS